MMWPFKRRIPKGRATKTMHGGVVYEPMGCTYMVEYTDDEGKRTFKTFKDEGDARFFHVRQLYIELRRQEQLDTPTKPKGQPMCEEQYELPDGWSTMETYPSNSETHVINRDGRIHACSKNCPPPSEARGWQYVVPLARRHQRWLYKNTAILCDGKALLIGGSAPLRSDGQHLSGDLIDSLNQTQRESLLAFFQSHEGQHPTEVYPLAVNFLNIIAP